MTIRKTLLAGMSGRLLANSVTAWPVRQRRPFLAPVPEAPYVIPDSRNT